MTILEINTDPISRVYVNDPESQFEEQPDRDLATTMMDYHDGNDVKHIKQKMAERFATEITVTENDQGEKLYNQVKTKQAQLSAIKNDLFEIDVRGICRKITNNVATLSENSIFEYTDEQFQEDIAESRERGDFGMMFGRLDEISVMVGSSVMLVQICNNDYQYQPITPDKVWIVYGEEIVVNDKTVPVDPFNIEHAQSVTIQLDDEQFATYIGRCDKHPNGRFVKYESKEWHNIPDIGDNDTDDYMLGDDEYSEVANPLTVLQDDTGDYTTPEYPIITWQGTTQGIGKYLLPVQTSTYEMCKEIDLSSSRASMSANKNARGFIAYTNEGGVLANQGATDDEGVQNLSPGQSVMILTVPAGNIQVANDTINMRIKSLADSWSVPQYNLAIDTATVPSGTALMETNRPQIKFQNKRKDINDGQIQRLFEIEKALAGIETGSEVGSDVEQVWLLKPADIFKTDLEIINETKELLALGLIDKANALVRIEGMTTEEAQEFIDSLVITPVANTTANRLSI